MKKSTLLVIGLLFLIASPIMGQNCGDPCSVTDYCQNLKYRTAGQYQRICDALAANTYPFLDDPCVAPGLVARLEQVQYNYLRLVGDPDLLPWSLEYCTNPIPMSDWITCVEPEPAGAMNTFDPDQPVFDNNSVQLIHSNTEFWIYGIVAKAGLDRIVEEKGPQRVYSRLNSKTCESLMGEMVGNRCLGYLMSDGSDQRPCNDPTGANYSAAFPNFQGSELWMIGGTLGSSHLRSTVCTVIKNQSPSLTIHLPMDAIYTKYHLSLQDYYESMLEAGMVRQFITEFFIFEMRYDGVPGADIIFGEQSPYNISVYLDDVLMHQYGDESGSDLNFRLTSHYFAGEDHYLAGSSSVQIGSTVPRTGWTYLWDDGATGPSRTVTPTTTTTYTLTGISDVGFVHSDEVTVYVNEPDLALESLSWQPANPIPGETVQFSARVRNTSSSRSTSFSCFFFEIDGDIFWVDSGPIHFSPGEVRELTSPTWTAQTGVYQIRAVGAGLGDQSHNNSMEATLDVTAAPADLQMVDVQTPSLVDPMGTMDVTYRIRNNGQVAAVNFEVGIRTLQPGNPCIFEDPVVSDFIQQLDPGEEQLLTVSLPIPTGVSSFMVSANADLNDPTGDNCLIGGTTNIRRPDLAVSTASAGNDRIAPGISTITIDYSVSNNACFGSGSGWPALSSQTAFYLAPTAQIPPSETFRLTMEDQAPVLAEGETAGRTVTLDLPSGFPEGSYYLHIRSDSANDNEECQESNNFLSTPIPLEVVSFCDLADVNRDGLANVLDLILLVNNMVTLAGVSNENYNLVSSAPGFPELIDMIDLSEAYPCVWGPTGKTPTEHSTNQINDVWFTQPGKTTYTVHVELAGSVNTLETHVRLPSGFEFTHTKTNQILLGSDTGVLTITPDNILSYQAHAGLTPATSTNLNGQYRVDDLTVSPNLDLTQTINGTGTEPGITVKVLFADGTVATLSRAFDYLDIPDPAFRAHITQYLGLPAGSGIPKHLADNVLNLDMNGAGIASLEGIQHLTNLRTLHVSDNMLESIPSLSGFSDLASVIADRNQLIEFPDLPISIRYLSLADNQIRSVPDLTALSQLNTMIIRNNRIGQLPPLVDLTGLLYLDCSMNSLTRLPWLPTQMTHLIASHNQLVELTWIKGGPLINDPDVPRFPQWLLVDASYNQLTHLDPHLFASHWIEEYGVLDLSHNNLDTRICPHLISFEYLLALGHVQFTLHPQTPELMCPLIDAVGN